MDILHQKAFELFLRDLDDSLSIDERMALESHLKTCEVCQADRRLYLHLKDEARTAWPDPVIHLGLDSLVEGKRPRLRKAAAETLRAAGWAVMAICLALVFIWGITSLRTEQRTPALSGTSALITQTPAPPSVEEGVATSGFQLPTPLMRILFWFSNNDILAGLAPALLITLGGIWIWKQKSGRWLAGYLLLVFSVLLVLSAILRSTIASLNELPEAELASLCVRFEPNRQPGLTSACLSGLSVILEILGATSILETFGVLAGLFYYASRPLRGWRGWLWLAGQAGLFVLVIATWVFTTVHNGQLAEIFDLLLPFVLLPGVLLSIIWQMRKLPGGRAGIVLLAVLGLATAAYEIYSAGGRSLGEDGLSALYNLALAILLPVLSTGLSAMLAGGLVSLEWKRHYWRAILYLAGITFLIWLFSYLILSESIWGHMEDSEGGFVLVIIGIITGIGACILLAWRLSGSKKLVALILALIFATSFILAKQVGDNKTPESLTFQRALDINRAIEKFQARNGRYPETLSELTPWYLFTIPRPFMFRDLGWCYQGDEDFYRFGYVYRPIAYVPAEYIEIRIQGSAGVPPQGGWDCERDLEAKRAIAPSN